MLFKHLLLKMPEFYILVENGYCLGRKGGKHRHRGKTLIQSKIIFPPSTLPVKVEQLIAWPRRKLIKTQGKKISYIFPPVEIHRYCHKKKIVSSRKNMI